MQQDISFNHRALAVFGFLCLTFLWGGTNGLAQMGQADMVTLSGIVIDMTCASKGKAMMGNWKNTANDHMMPSGVQKDCAVMCLKGGQPAALFAGDQISAVFACNPRATLSDYVGKSVQVQGNWAGDGAAVKVLVPIKIRTESGAWTDVNCANMH